MLTPTQQSLAAIRHRRYERARKRRCRKRGVDILLSTLAVSILLYAAVSYIEILHRSADGLSGESPVYSRYNAMFVVDNIFGTHMFDDIPQK